MALIDIHLPFLFAILRKGKGYLYDSQLSDSVMSILLSQIFKIQYLRVVLFESKMFGETSSKIVFQMLK